VDLRANVSMLTRLQHLTNRCPPPGPRVDDPSAGCQRESQNSLPCSPSVSQNFLQGLTLPDRLGGLAHLEELHIHSCVLTSLPSSITQLQRLRLLNLEWCVAMAELPSELGKLSGLQDLTL